MYRAAVCRAAACWVSRAARVEEVPPKVEEVPPVVTVTIPLKPRRRCDNP